MFSDGHDFRIDSFAIGLSAIASRRFFAYDTYMTRGTIVLIGPEGANEKLLNRRLTNEGWSVEVLKNLTEAGRWLQSQKPQVILLSSRLGGRERTVVAGYVHDRTALRAQPVIALGDKLAEDKSPLASIVGESLDLESVPIKEATRRIELALRLTHLVT